jgi:phosphoglycolate phosphatase
MLKIKGIKLVIFDLDGTLVDAYPAIISSFNYAMQILGYPSQNKLVIRRSVGWGDRNLLRPFVKARDLCQALIIYRRDHRKTLVRKSRLFPASRKVLAYLSSKGYKLAVASNRPTQFSMILIRHLGLDRYLDYVLCADKLKYMKPHPLILRKVMAKFSVRPRDTLYIGDMIIDAKAGRRSRARTVIVTTGSNTRREVSKEKPYRVISNIAGLLRIL